MPAYIIVDVTIYNESEYAKYRGAETPATVEKYDGKFIVRGGKSRNHRRCMEAWKGLLLWSFQRLPVQRNGGILRNIQL